MFISVSVSVSVLSVLCISLLDLALALCCFCCCCLSVSVQDSKPGAPNHPLFWEVGGSFSYARYLSDWDVVCMVGG